MVRTYPPGTCGRKRTLTSYKGSTTERNDGGQKDRVITVVQQSEGPLSYRRTTCGVIIIKCQDGPGRN